MCPLVKKSFYIIYVILIGSLAPKIYAQELDIEDEAVILDLEAAEKQSETLVNPNGDGQNLTSGENSSGLVRVESDNHLYDPKTRTYTLYPYSVRRPEWTGTFGVSISMFEPTYYEPNFVTDEFKNVYASAESPLIELNIGYKWNVSIGSLGLDFGAGFYNNQSTKDLIDSTIQLIPVRAGLMLALDNMFEEPYVVPYAAAGGYVMFFSEELEGGNSVNGNTEPALYFSGGFMFQLDWLDPSSSRIAYEEAEIENTFIFAELRKFMTSNAIEDPDFGTDLHINAGFKVEL